MEEDLPSWNDILSDKTVQKWFVSALGVAIALGLTIGIVRGYIEETKEERKATKTK